MSKKVKQLAEVIALQEKTISKLQKVIEHKNKSKSKNKQCDSTQQSQAKQDMRYIPCTYTKKLDFNNNGTDRSGNTFQRTRPSVSQTHNQQLSQISTDCALNSIRGKMDGIKQELTLFNKDIDKQHTLRIEQLERDCRDKDRTIISLQEQLYRERQDKEGVQIELQKQRSTWQTMYNDLQQELNNLKLDLKLFSSPKMGRSRQLNKTQLHFQNHLY